MPTHLPATAGIGLATAKRFLELGATVVMHGRNMERGRGAARGLIKQLQKEGHGNVSSRVVVMYVLLGWRRRGLMGWWVGG